MSNFYHNENSSDDDERHCCYVVKKGDRKGLICGRLTYGDTNYCKIHLKKLKDVILTKDTVPDFLRNSELYRNEFIDDNDSYPIPTEFFLSKQTDLIGILRYLKILSYWNVDINFNLFSTRNLEIDIFTLNDCFLKITDLNYLVKVIEMFFTNISDGYILFVIYEIYLKIKNENIFFPNINIHSIAFNNRTFLDLLVKNNYIIANEIILIRNFLYHAYILANNVFICEIKYDKLLSDRSNNIGKLILNGIDPYITIEVKKDDMFKIDMKEKKIYQYMTDYYIRRFNYLSKDEIRFFLNYIRNFYYEVIDYILEILHHEMNNYINDISDNGESFLVSVLFLIKVRFSDVEKYLNEKHNWSEITPVELSDEELNQLLGNREFTDTQKIQIISDFKFHFLEEGRED